MMNESVVWVLGSETAVQQEEKLWESYTSETIYTLNLSSVWVTTSNGLNVSSPGTTVTQSWWWCSGSWRPPEHILFQISHGCVLAALFGSDDLRGLLFLHLVFALAFFLQAAWSWSVACSPDAFTWALAFLMLNIGQTFHVVFRLRPVKFPNELEAMYGTLFQPLAVSRALFKRLVGTEYAQLLSLHAGEAYALEGLTRTDRLGLLLSGRVHVMNGDALLHPVTPTQFLDSPEFEAAKASADEKFQVSIVAAEPCRYVFWQRSALEYLFAKETHLATVMAVLVSRDVASKLYAMNRKIVTAQGSHLDIRLPSLTSTLTLFGADNTISPSHRRSVGTTSVKYSEEQSVTLLREEEREDAEPERTPLLAPPIDESGATLVLSGGSSGDVEAWLDASSRFHSCCSHD